MSGSDWHISNASGRALAAVAAGARTDPDLLAASEMARLAYRHGLVVPAARALGPDRARGRYLMAVAARMSARQACIDQHLLRILTRLAEADVRASVVKGPSVAGLYRDPSVRSYTDIDLVVPADQLGTTLETLRGYEDIGAIPAKVPEADKRDIVVRDPTGIQFSVDLHWDLFSFHQLGGSADSAMAEAWQAATFDPDHHLGPMWRLPEDVVVAFLSLHALLDHRFRLILFRDLAEVAQHPHDWDRSAAFAERHGLASLQYLAWLIAARVVGADLPGSFLERLRGGSWPERIAERYLARVDLVRFDGHSAHPLNLALTQAHDHPAQRRRLLLRAPLAYPGWRRRVHVTSAASSYSVDILVTSNARRGAEVFGRSLTDELVRRGWDASLISLGGGGAPGVDATPLVDEGVALRGLRPSVVRALRRRFRTSRPPVVFANGGATLRYAVAASFLLRDRPKLVYGSIGEPTFWLRGRLHRRWQRLLLAFCHHVAAVSDATATALRGELSVPEERLSVIRPGVDRSWFRLPTHANHPGPLRVLFAGSLSFEKDPLTAVETVVGLSGDAVLRLAGEGPLREEVQRAASGGVEVLGTVQDMQLQMEWADVLLLPSLTEGLPGVAVEAAAAGVPTVASDVGGTGEIVVHGETGYLVGPGDVESFIDVLQTLAEDAELRTKMGEAARRRAWEHFRVEDTVDAYERIFQQAARR